MRSSLDHRSSIIAQAAVLQSTNGIVVRPLGSQYPRALRPGLVCAFVALALTACGGGGGGGGGGEAPSAVSANCSPGLVKGFAGDIGDAPIPIVNGQPGSGEGTGAGGDGGGGSVGGGEGNGIGGADGQYANVVVTVEAANGRTFGPWPLDETKGMVTYVHCGLPLPAKVTFEGKAANATYYDEGLGRDVSFAGKKRIGLISRYETNTGVTGLTHALYERAMAIGRARGIAEGWRDATVVDQAHAELLAVVNDQLPGLYRLADLRRLPVMLNSRNDKEGSGVLSANPNGVYGALLAGLAQAAATNLATSQAPALDLAEALIADLGDGRVDLAGTDAAPVGATGKVPYSYESLWSHATVGTGVAAARNGTGSLRTDSVAIGYVRSKAIGAVPAGAVAETEYTLGSGGELVVNLDPGKGGAARRPAAGLKFSQLYRFGLEPVVALRRDGRGLLVFPTSWDGSLSFEVTAPASGATIVELFDPGYPAVRLSDGSLHRLQGNALVPEPAPAGALNFTCRSEFAGALAAPADPSLGAANGTLCFGPDAAGQVRAWRPSGSAAGRAFALPKVVQVSGNEQILLALQADGAVVQLDADHAVRFRNAAGAEVSQLVGGETRELVAAGSAPVRVAMPKACWVRAPFVVACDGVAYAMDYREFTAPDGSFAGAGPITGIKRVPIPTDVWRTRANRRLASATAELASDAVFIGVDGRIFDVDGKPKTLPLDGTPLERPNQPPLAPVIAVVAGDNVLTAAEATADLVVAGSAQAGTSIVVALAGRSRSTVANGQGQWQVAFPPAELPTGDVDTVIEATASSAAGTSQPSRQTLKVVRAVPAAPTIAAVADDNVVSAAEAAAGVIVRGTAPVGTTVTVTWGSASKAVSVSSGSTWAALFAATEIPAPGRSTVRASAANVNGPGPTAEQAVDVLAAPARATISSLTYVEVGPGVVLSMTPVPAGGSVLFHPADELQLVGTTPLGGLLLLEWRSGSDGSKLAEYRPPVSANSGSAAGGAWEYSIGLVPAGGGGATVLQVVFCDANGANCVVGDARRFDLQVVSGSSSASATTLARRRDTGAR